MTKTISASSFVTTTFAIAALFAFALPSFAFAAEYAYVNHEGEVQTVTANNSAAALSTAPGLSLHSGVIILDSDADRAFVGDIVSGV